MRSAYPPRPLEADEQEAVVQYCAYAGIDVIHIPNEGKRSAWYGAKLRAVGLKSGVPDLFIPAARKGFHGLFIEMKRDGKAKPTRAQLEWNMKLNSAGYRAVICYGAAEAIRVLQEYFAEEKR